MTDDEPENETSEMRARHELMARAHQARLAERRSPRDDSDEAVREA